MMQVIKPSSHSEVLIIIIDENSLPQFTELVQRGANLWPDAKPETKEFADIITNGKVMQTYR